MDEQIAAMAARWPTFDVITQGLRTAIWEGTLDPVKRRYRVRISVRLPYAIENFTALQVQPRVQVLNPILERHPEFEEGPVPHVYINEDAPSLPFLCLFDPYDGEWSLSDLVADTTVPWTVRYLYFYEGWLVTGKWLGGGKHLTEAELSGERPQKTVAAL